MVLFKKIDDIMIFIIFLLFNGCSNNDISTASVENSLFETSSSYDNVSVNSSSSFIRSSSSFVEQQISSSLENGYISSSSFSEIDFGSSSSSLADYKCTKDLSYETTDGVRYKSMENSYNYSDYVDSRHYSLTSEQCIWNSSGDLISKGSYTTKEDGYSLSISGITYRYNGSIRTIQSVSNDVIDSIINFVIYSKTETIITDSLGTSSETVSERFFDVTDLGTANEEHRYRIQERSDDSVGYVIYSLDSSGFNSSVETISLGGTSNKTVYEKIPGVPESIRNNSLCSANKTYYNGKITSESTVSVLENTDSSYVVHVITDYPNVNMGELERYFYYRKMP
jgi:hypothetical protein